MTAGLLLGLFCVLVGFVLGLWMAYFWWREKIARMEFDQAFRTGES